MTTAIRGQLHRHRFGLSVALVLALGFTYAIRATGAPVIPLPNPLVKVKTTSGSVVRERLIPLGGAPVPLDVDERKLLGLLWPDVDASVGLIAAEELPDKPIVPTIEINRDPTAVLRKAPAPPLRIDLTIELKDAGNGLRDLASITYGYETPEGALVPTKFKTKLIGPIQGGFVDPLEATVETPGYNAPLKLNAKVLTDAFDGTFAVAANPLPDRIHFVEDPREDGLDFRYDHYSATQDIKLDAAFDLKDRADGNRLRHVDAHVERLPQTIMLANTNTTERVHVDYQASSPLAPPDIEANYRDTKGDGTIVTDANVKIAGLPSHITGEVNFVPDGDGGSAVDAVDFDVAPGQEIEALDFLARNYVGPPGPIPEPQLNPEQYIAAATRQMPDATTRFRAAGRLLGVRSLRLERQEADNERVDVTTDLGDGTQPLRAIVDLDNRGPGGPPDPDDRKRLKVDATVTPLPRTMHVNYDPARGGAPTSLVYDSPQSVDVDADALIADAETTNGCGEAEVTCLKARIDKLPPHLAATLPGPDGTDFSLSHTGTGGSKPDVRAEVDRTPADTSGRSYANVELLRVPNEVTGRMDVSRKDVVRAAEFHACTWSFATEACTDAQQALGRVTFTVRDGPTRVGLPPRPDTATNFVTLLSRDPAFAIAGDEHFEVTGRVDEARNVAFRQRDLADDGEPDGTLGAKVDVGTPNTPFDVAVDTAGFLADPDDEEVNLGDTTSRVNVHVDKLPSSFGACVREQQDTAPPSPTSLPADGLLSDCDRTNVLGRIAGQLTSTPMSVAYQASARTKVSADVASTAPDVDDDNRPATTELTATVDTVPKRLRTDVIPPITPDPAEGIAGRKLEFAYDADDGDAATDDSVPTITFDLAARRANSLCEDPRRNRKATCVSGVLKDLPKTLNATFDPDESKGDITISAAAPGSGQPKLAINPAATVTDPFRLSTVAPDSSPLVVEARIEDIASELRGKLQQLNLDGEDESATGSLATRIATCDDDADNDGADGTDADDPDCEPDMARFAFDACPGVAPENLTSCNGVGKLTFKATNALVGDPLDPVPAGPPGVTQDFSFVQVGDDFRAAGTINKFKQVALDRLDHNDVPGETTKLRAAFGNGDASDKIRAYVDRDSGTEAQRIDAVIAQAPQAVNLCLRGAVNSADVRSGAGFGFCETAASDKTAIETRLDAPAGTAKPDITVSTFELSKGGGADTLRGIPGPDPAIRIDDLAQKIQVLAGEADKAQGKRADLLVEGRTLGGALDDVAGRVGFALQTFKDPLANVFPRASLSGSTDPELDPDNDDAAGAPNAGRNYLKIIGAREKLQFKGSVPAIKRIRLDPRPCNPSDARFPAEADFDPAVRPEYTCINALAAQGRPLGLAVRTLDASDELLSIDEGGLDTVPAGAGGLLATLTKSPDAAKPNEVCAATATATAANGCRPPFISVEAPRASGQVPHFRARLATGPRDLVEDLRDDADPIDVLSQRLDFEESPGDWTTPGGRLKLGTRGDDIAIRASFNLEIPQFLDIDPPTSYACKHLQQTVLGDCDEENVSAKDHQGFEAKDIFIKLVGSNTGHGDRDLDTLGPNGRMALLVHDFDKSKQTIVTGAVAADGPSGTTTTNGERANFPAAGVADKGLVIPGYLDAKVYLRDDYTAANDDAKEQKFIQVDGRVNHPLSLTMRLNEPDEFGRYGENRSGDTVPSQQFTVRNAPCAGRPDCGPYENESFAEPSFRIRAEVRSARPKPKDERCKGVDEWGAGFGFTACLILPQPDTRWMNVDLNHDPGSDDPARTVEAVADSKDGNYDLRAFRNVNDKSVNARFSPQAALRLTPLEAGFRAGIGIGIVGAKTEMSMNADLIPTARGLANHQLRLSQDGLAVRLKSAGGKSTVATDMRGYFHTEVTEEAIFGLISSTQTHDTVNDHIHLLFEQCPTFNLPSFLVSHDGFEITNDSEKAAGQLVPGPLQAASPAAAVITGVNAFLVPIFCLLPNTEDNDLVTATKPAPRWTEPDRPIEDIGEQPDAGGGGGSVLTPQPPTKTDLTITGGTTTLCGTVSAKTLHITSTGVLRAGAEGTTIPGPPPTTTTITCDGRLFLDVDRLIVDAGGVLDASATRTTAGPGFPGSGLGGGAGHAGTGGASGSGGPGGGMYGNDTNLTDQFGSRGRGGSSGASGGLGGGVLRVNASDDIVINGVVRAGGGGGGGVAGTNCANTSAGGGSGGAIALAANKVTVGGTVHADGGFGGSGSHGGGGGAGGRVRIDTVIRTVTGSVRANGGIRGTHGGSCNDGVNGSAGAGSLGQELGLAAGVTRDATSPWVQGSVDLRLKGVQKGGGDLDIVYCRATVPLGTQNPFDDPGIEPPSVSDTEDLDVGSPTCRTRSFSAPTSGGDTYEATVTWSGLADSYYGFYAFAKDDNLIFDDYQPLPPTTSTVKLGSDSTAPNITDVTRRNGVAGCDSGAFCLDATTGLLRLVASDGNGSGIVEGKCSVNGGAFNQDCLPGDNVAVQLGGDGARTVDIRLRDQAGNEALASSSGREANWFVDLKAPGTPAMTLAQSGSPVNGWYKAAPQLTVTATDPAASAGFAADGITVLVDEAERTCPATAPAGATITCAPADTAAFVPTNGIHAFRASAVDKLGHRSDLQTTCAGSVVAGSCTMKVDSKPPTSRVFIGPKKPDGKAGSGFYKTRPFFAFAASDGAGGSGVDLSKPPSKIRFRIDAGALQDYDPGADDDLDPGNDNRLAEGRHTICFHAIDVADNAESPSNCSSEIKIDTHAPTASAAIAPASPNGTNGYYTTTPVITPSGAETIPAGVPAADTSGLDRVEYQLDMGPWTPAAAFGVPEGRHEVRVRAFDKAGNASPVDERIVFVDKSKPTARIASYPPRPNGRDWFRQARQDAVAVADGRDGSGADGATVAIDAAPPTAYLQPFAIGHGIHSVTARGRDRAGLQGDPVVQSSKIDTSAPVPQIATPDPQFLSLLGNATLRFNVTDSLTPRVKVIVWVFDELGILQRRLDVPGDATGYRATGPGSIVWNGRKSDGRGVLPGLYHYRVQAVDEAGNSAISTESAQFLVVLTGLPL